MPRNTEQSGERKGSNGELLGRRSYLRITGGVVGSLVVAAGATGATAAADENDTGAGEEISASSAGGIEAALDEASSGDTVIVDGTFEGEEIDMKSGVDLVGRDDGSSTIRGDHADVLRVEDVSGVHIDNVAVDGSGGAARCIGSAQPGRISNISVTNCRLTDASNGVSLRGTGDDQRFEDITIADNEIRTVERFGVFVGLDSGNGGFANGIARNVEIRNNHIEDVSKWRGITVSGLPSAPVEDCVVAENVVENVERNGIFFENVVRDSRVENNEIRGVGGTFYGCTGGAHDNEFRGNTGEDGRVGFLCSGNVPYPGNPEDNLFVENTVEGTGFAVLNRKSEGNTYRRNTFVGFEHRTTASSLDTFEDNTWRS